MKEVKNYNLSSKTWHGWLMKKIWDMEPKEFTNMCPYFWLTVFNVFWFLPYMLLIKPLFWTATASVYTYKNHETRTADELYEALLHDDTLLIAYCILNHKDQLKGAKRKALLKLINLDYKRYTHFDNIAYKKQSLIDDGQREAKKLKKARMMGMVNTIKTVCKWLLVAGAIVGLYFLFKMCGKFTWSGLLKALFAIGVAGGFISLVVGAFALGNYLESKYTYKETKFKKVVDFVLWPFGKILMFLTWLVISLWNLLKATVKLIHTMYKNACPGITWED